MSPEIIEIGICNNRNKNSIKANFMPSGFLRIFFISHFPYTKECQFFWVQSDFKSVIWRMNEVNMEILWSW